MRMHVKSGKPIIDLGECQWCGNKLGLLCIHYQGKRYDSQDCFELDNPSFEDEEGEEVPCTLPPLKPPN